MHKGVLFLVHTTSPQVALINWKNRRKTCSSLRQTRSSQANLFGILWAFSNTVCLLFKLDSKLTAVGHREMLLVLQHKPRRSTGRTHTVQDGWFTLEISRSYPKPSPLPDLWLETEPIAWDDTWAAVEANVHKALRYDVFCHVLYGSIELFDAGCQVVASFLCIIQSCWF